MIVTLKYIIMYLILLFGAVIDFKDLNDYIQKEM